MIRAPEPCGCAYKEIGPSMADYCGGGALLTFMAILEAYINGRCDIADPCGRVPESRQLDYDYDFIVVGGGTAGPVVAARLSENPDWKVLLIEAGGDEPPVSAVPSMTAAFWNNSESDWMYYTEPQEKACKLEKDSKCRWPRAKLLGGCSVVNGMMYMRGVPEDFNLWEKSGVKGWSWGDVKPWFLFSEDNAQIGSLVTAEHHSKGGPLTVQQFRHAPELANYIMQAGAEIGFPPSLDLNGDALTGFTVAQTLNKDGSRLSTARAYVRPASHRSNLHVALNTMAHRLVFNTGSTKVAGVELHHRGVKKTIRASKEVILTAGAINSPQLLLLSGVGPASALNGHGIQQVLELPGVGQNLQNHIGVTLEFELAKENATNLLDWTVISDYLLSREGPMASTGMSQVTGRVNSRFANADGTYPDVQFFFNGYAPSCASSGEIGAPEDPANPKAHRVVEIACIYLHPESRGHIELASKNPFDAPKMYPNYFQVDKDLDAVADAARIAFKLANTSVLRDRYDIRIANGFGKKCKLNPNKEPTEDQMKCLVMHHTSPENHQVGTCKMGPSEDKMAVVDESLSVHGLTGVRVMDASVMPFVTSGNTMAPVIMIAERGSFMIKEKWMKSTTMASSDVDVGNRFNTEDQGTFNVNFNPNTFNLDGFNKPQPEVTTFDQSGQTEPTESLQYNYDSLHYYKPHQIHHSYHQPYQHDKEWHKKNNVPLPRVLP